MTMSVESPLVRDQRRLGEKRVSARSPSERKARRAVSPTTLLKASDSILFIPNNFVYIYSIPDLEESRVPVHSMGTREGSRKRSFP